MRPNLSLLQDTDSVTRRSWDLLGLLVLLITKFKNGLRIRPKDNFIRIWKKKKSQDMEVANLGSYSKEEDGEEEERKTMPFVSSLTN